MHNHGIGIHVGLARVDARAYEGFDGARGGGADDARALHAIARRAGFDATLLVDEDATAAALLAALNGAARALGEGGQLLLTFAGHGGDVPGAPPMKRERVATWLLFDRMLLQPELDAVFRRFAPGVRIHLVADTCHSDGVDRVTWFAAARRNGACHVRARNVPDDVLAMLVARHRDLFERLQCRTAYELSLPLHASLIALTACQQNQLAEDGARHGLFTEKLLDTWRSGAFRGDHHAFHRAIVRAMPPAQTPALAVSGGADLGFERSRPFTLAGGIEAANDADPPDDDGDRHDGGGGGGARVSSLLRATRGRR